MSEAEQTRAAKAAKASVKIAQSPGGIAACASLHLSKEAASCAEWVALVSAALRALPRGRKPFQPASALAPATGKAAREGLPTRAKTTFTKDAGGRQRAAHTDAVPGYPRELRGLDQNRDIDDALLRGGLRLAEAEFRQTKGRRSTGWE